MVNVVKRDLRVEIFSMSDAMICVCVISVSKRYAAETRSSRVKIASSSLWYTSKKCIIIGALLDEIQFQSFSSTRESYRIMLW
jgi:hypothetical protein